MKYIENFKEKLGRRKKAVQNMGSEPFIRKLFPRRPTEMSKEEYLRQNAAKCLKYGVFLLMSFAVLRGALVTVKSNIPVNNTVNGRELPIYCVETQEKKIALSFDAAWGGSSLRFCDPIIY